MFLTVSPAYGRDYKSGKAAKEDWNADKDFIIRTFGPGDGSYINKADALKNLPKGSTITIRFARDAKLTVVKV